MKPYAERFYKSKTWEKCRYAFLCSKNWTCERCGHLATIAHHKQYITPQNINDPNVTLNWDNLEALCEVCHNKEHMSKGACKDGLTFDRNGNLVKTPPAASSR